MSKNKNPLKDLDLFLKQQASSLVSPTPLSDRVQKAETPEVKEVKKPEPATEPSIDGSLLSQLNLLAQRDKNALFDLLIEMAEKEDNPENAMLINTVLYMKHGESWRDAVRQYWRNR